ncbi:Protein-lysine methyltransferase METTL21E [Seminavis robusta]|uniref:Protein-lysine methyltransferase METTL21E n=1 Tax=Seminavis robusta TaxID=568900 RepID=A0A9N8DQA5_9STRA|nr:Protein-lysine methyltransferase METTL21E [Seminavis robusta]|eukprot:Sro295_g110470.1 Protein-lysine methyltransferase METTL21E (397) ;mRNA; f:43157-44347
MTTSTSINSRKDDELLLVAAVVWDLQGSGETKTSKIRIRQRDIIQHGVCTPRDLWNMLQSSLVSVLPEASSSLWQMEAVQVYDNNTNSYVSIPLLSEDDDDPTIMDVTRRFGTRLRIHVTTTTNGQHNNNNNQPEPPKAIMGRYYSYNPKQGILIAGIPLRVQETTLQNATGGNVWDGALLLARYLEKTATSLVTSKRVLELGAGCGLVGIAAGILGAKQVLLTDLPYALENMNHNVKQHWDACQTAGCQQMVCAPLDWYHPPSLEELGNSMKTPSSSISEQQPWIPELILIADCVWMQPLVQPLLATVEHLVTQAAACQTHLTTTRTTIIQVLISYQRRGKSTHEEFWNGIHGLRFQSIIKQQNVTNVTEVIDVTKVGLAKPDSIHLLLLEINLS